MQNTSREGPSPDDTRSEAEPRAVARYGAACPYAESTLVLSEAGRTGTLLIILAAGPECDFFTRTAVIARSFDSADPRTIRP